MTHLDEGTLLAIRDRAVVDAEDRRHVESCSVCGAALRGLGDRAALISHALDALGTAPDIESAKARVRARIDARLEGERAWRPWRLPLGRAAALLIVAAGAAYAATPGSPLMRFIRGSGTTVEAPPAPSQGEPANQEPGRTGVEVDVPDSGLRIVLTNVAPGAQVRLVWIDDRVARLSAAEGSTYALAEGRAEAAVAPGPVRVDVFRGVSRLVLEINGTRVLDGPAHAPLPGDGNGVRSAGGVVFDVPVR